MNCQLVTVVSLRTGEWDLSIWAEGRGGAGQLKTALTGILRDAAKAEQIMIQLLGEGWHVGTSVPESNAAKGEVGFPCKHRVSLCCVLTVLAVQIKNNFKLWVAMRGEGRRIVVRAMAANLKAVPNPSRYQGPPDRGCFHFALIGLWSDGEWFTILSGLAEDFGPPRGGNVAVGNDRYETAHAIAPLREELEVEDCLAYASAKFCTEFVRQHPAPGTSALRAVHMLSPPPDPARACAEDDARRLRLWGALAAWLHAGVFFRRGERGG